MKRTSKASRPRRIPRVTVFVTMRCCYGPSVMRGIFAHIAAHGEWRLDVVRTESAFNERTISDAVRHRADGFIVAVTDDLPAFQTLAATGLPYVSIENAFLAAKPPSPLARHVRLDNFAIGRTAAREFAAEGRAASFGYVTERRAPSEWSRLRRQGFEEEIRRRDGICKTFAGDAGDSAAERLGKLAHWLKALPRPAAVLAADDNTALDVLQACSAARLRVPDDVAVLGVDDEEFVCESTSPTLSSIRPNFTEAGRLAAETLERLMRGGGRRKSSAHELLVKGEYEVVRRDSTARESSAGPLVQRALAFIRQNAKNGIGVRDVVAHLRVSRSLADLRFREVRGESILSVITAARLKELKARLAQTNEPINEITRRLGWTSENYPKNLFRRHFGLSMKAYRDNCAKSGLTPPATAPIFAPSSWKRGLRSRSQRSSSAPSQYFGSPTRRAGESGRRWKSG